MSFAVVAVAGVAAVGAGASAAVQSSANSKAAKAIKAGNDLAYQRALDAGSQSMSEQLKMYGLSAGELQNAVKLVGDYQASAKNAIVANQTPYSQAGTDALGNINYGMGVSKLARQGVTPEIQSGLDSANKSLADANAAREAFNAKFGADTGSWEEKQQKYGSELSTLANNQATAQAAVQAAQAKFNTADANKETDAQYQARLDAEKADPNFGKYTKSYQEATGDKFPTWTPTTIKDMENDPGYQFRLEQGQKTYENSAASRGQLLGGNAAKALSDYGQNYASNEFDAVNQRRQQDYSAQTGAYTQKYNMFNMDRDTPYSKFMTMLDVGQNANANINNATTHYYDTLSGAASGYASNMANLNTSLANTQTGINMQMANAGQQQAQGNAQASANQAVNQGNITSGLINSLASTVGTGLAAWGGTGGTGGTPTAPNVYTPPTTGGGSPSGNLNNQVGNALSGWATQKNLFG